MIKDEKLLFRNLLDIIFKSKLKGGKRKNGKLYFPIGLTLRKWVRNDRNCKNQ